MTTENTTTENANPSINQTVTNQPDINLLTLLLKNNPSVDWRNANLHDAQSIATYNRDGLEADEEALLKLIKAYQRLLRVLPEDVKQAGDIAIQLLKAGFDSALQIANTAKNIFIQAALEIFGNDRDLAERVYQRAIACRKSLALRYLNLAQGSEPHARAAGLNK